MASSWRTSPLHGEGPMLLQTRQRMTVDGSTRCRSSLMNWKRLVSPGRCRSQNQRNEDENPSRRTRLSKSLSGLAAVPERVYLSLSAIYSPTDWESIIQILQTIYHKFRLISTTIPERTINSFFFRPSAFDPSRPKAASIGLLFRIILRLGGPELAVFSLSGDQLLVAM